MFSSPKRARLRFAGYSATRPHSTWTRWSCARGGSTTYRLTCALSPPREFLVPGCRERFLRGTCRLATPTLTMGRFRNRLLMMRAWFCVSALTRTVSSGRRALQSTSSTRLNLTRRTRRKQRNIPPPSGSIASSASVRRWS